jgi:hypothetical protein
MNINNKERIGIITMHRVKNFGSALQAYALQECINRLGYNAELIDYVFPNECQPRISTVKKKIKNVIVDALLGFTLSIKSNRFSEFYRNFFKLSVSQYKSKKEIQTVNHSYDLIITGSDQVWNWKHIGSDTTFMGSFCNDDKVPRISFASSFSSSIIPEDYKQLYSNYLSKYIHISVREKAGLTIIKDLLKKDAGLVCDPTLLLNKKDWSNISNLSRIKIKQPYILAYILTYSFDPYPQINNFIEILQKKTGLNVVYLSGSFGHYIKNNSTVIRSAGPCEFIRLFSEASYIITTSYHGTAFALNFSVPFNSVISRNYESDSRIIDLLSSVKAINRALYIDDKEYNPCPMDYNEINSVIEKFRYESSKFLSIAIKESLSQRLS